MRKIILKLEPMEQKDEDGESILFSYRERLIGLLRFPAPPRQGENAGLDLQEIAKVLPLIKTLNGKKDGDELIVEDEEWRLISDRVKGARWNFADPVILQFGEDIKTAETISAEKVAADKEVAQKALGE